MFYYQYYKHVYIIQKVEYDLKNSVIDNLKVLSSTRIEQDAIPICLTTYPPIVKENFITVANDQVSVSTC